MKFITSIVPSSLLACCLLACNVQHGPRNSKRIALTFDDGPNPPYTEKVLQLLSREKVPATFFFLGRNIEMHRASALKAVQAGHEIGNHSFSHAALAWLKPGKIREEIETTDALIRSLGYSGPIPFRAPFGQKFGIHSWVLWRMHRLNILYDVAPQPPDYFRSDPRQTSENAFTHARNGTILLLHDGEGIRTEALEAAGELIPKLRASGFEFVRVSELSAPTGTKGPP